MQMSVCGKELLHLAIGFVDVLRIAGERDPAKRSLALAEQRPDIRGNEAREIERVRDAFVVGDLPDIVAVIERRDPLRVKRQHCVDVCGDRMLRRRRERIVSGRIVLRRMPVFDAPTRRQIAVNQIVR